MKEKNIPAFPIPLTQGQGWSGMAPCDGMTLRDYFAAKVMHQFLRGAVIPNEMDATEMFAIVANRSYEMADAMMKARINND